MSSHNPKQTLFDAFAETAKALGHPLRLAIVEQLEQGERSVEALAERLGLSVANASQHLRLMRSTGLLSSRRQGKHVLYSVSDSSVLRAVAAIQQIAERRSAEVRGVI